MDQSAVQMNAAYGHEAVAGALGIKRTTVFGLWKSGELKSIRIGKRRLSTQAQINEYLARLEAAAD